VGPGRRGSLVAEIFRYQSDAAGLRGLDRKRARSGAVQFPQRFGGSLNLNVHYHVAVPDGVFVRERARDATGNRPTTFHPLPRPTPAVLDDIVHAIEIRVTRWLRRKGLLADPDPDADFSNEPPEWSALDACLEGSLARPRSARSAAAPPSRALYSLTLATLAEIPASLLGSDRIWGDSSVIC